jgi:hypothetical protein
VGWRPMATQHLGAVHSRALAHSGATRPRSPRPTSFSGQADAVAVLDDISREVPTVAVVTHGAFRRILTLRLAATGGLRSAAIGGYRNWSVWPFLRVDVDSGEGNRCGAVTLSRTRGHLARPGAPRGAQRGRGRDVPSLSPARSRAGAGLGPSHRHRRDVRADVRSRWCSRPLSR